jgi:stage II sporulation protein D
MCAGQCALRRIALGALLVGVLAGAADAAEGTPPLVRVGLISHRTSAVIGSTAPFIVSAGGNEWQYQATTLTVCLPSAIPEGTKAEPRPGDATLCLIGTDGVGRWCAGPLRVRAAVDSGGCLQAGEDIKRLQRYEGELEVTSDAARTLSLVNVVDLEAYARGVMGGEMDPDYPAEALKAQAVATRSEALAKLGRHRADGFDLCAEAHCQAYRGVEDQTAAGNAAVAVTRGEILTYGGRPADAVYHAACGGHTENASDVWRCDDVPYLRGVPDREDGNGPGANGYRAEDAKLRAYLTGAPPANCRDPRYLPLTRFRWVRALTRKQIEASLADIVSIGELVDLQPLKRGMSGRIASLEVRGTKSTTTIGPEAVIRRALGGLPSSAFVIDRYCDDAGRPVVFVLWGAGWGHGVGMCQAGAAGLAQAGHSYREILAKYYHGTTIETRY